MGACVELRIVVEEYKCGTVVSASSSCWSNHQYHVVLTGFSLSLTYIYGNLPGDVVPCTTYLRGGYIIPAFLTSRF
jgi:hypothetical protein